MGVSVSKEIENAGVESAGLKDGSLTRFKPDLVKLVAFPALFDKTNEEIPVVVFVGDPVSTPQVEPAELLGPQKRAEVPVDRFQRHGKGIAALLAEGVEVKSTHSGEVGLREVVGRNAESGSWRAWIVETGCPC